MPHCPPPISCAIVDGRPVFADLADDSYFLLDRPEEARFLKRLAISRAGCELPLKLGRRRVTLVSRASPTTTVLDHASMSHRPSLREILMAWRLVLQARHAVRSRPIEDILEKLESGSTAPSRPAELLSLSCRFAAARKHVPVRRNCLADSLALLHWLGRQGLAANLIFGVKLDPFAAHCWVEEGNVLLNDHADEVERFTPVRLVRCAAAMR